MATGITESDVWTAADALLLEGARPTIERVRQKIGRGSPNTVSPYLETWFKALGARIRDPRAFASQEAVPDPVAQAAARLWDAALELARAEQAAAQRDAQAELAAQRRPMPTKPNACASMPWRWRRGKTTCGSAWPWPARSSKRPSRACAAEAQLRQRDAQWDAAQAQLAESRAAEQALQAQAEQARDAHAQAQSALESRHAAHERRWLNELDAERSAAKRLQSAGRGRRRRPTQGGRAGDRTGARRRTPAEDGTRGPGPVCRAGGAVDSVGGGAGLGALGGGAGGREREGAGSQPGTAARAAETQATALQARIRAQDEQLAALTRHLMMLTTPAPAASDATTGQGND